MAIISWGGKRQLAFFGIFALIAVAFIGWGVYVFVPEPSCIDRRQNQGEEGVDCGGPCAPCQNLIRPLNILWTRFFLTAERTVDVAALLENPNRFLRASRFVYAIKVYDSENILIAIKENTTFIEPGSRFIVFETDIPVGNRVPNRAVAELRDAVWEGAQPEVIQVDVLTTRRFLDGELPHLEVKIKNRSDRTYRDIEAQVVLYNAAGDAIGISKTLVERLSIDEEKDLLFTWPAPLPDTADIELFFRQRP